jgi:hypothetical protein
MGDDESRFICLPGSEVPNWFSHKGIGSSISFRVPSISKGQFLRLLVCAVYATDIGASGHVTILPVVEILNKTRGNTHFLRPTEIDTHKHSFLFPNKEDHFFLYLTPLIRNKYVLESGLIFNELVMESGDEIEVSISIWGLNVKKCGIHLLVDEPNVM